MHAWSLERPLLGLSDTDTWTIGNSFEGTQIFGATGSGKTSGSGAAIAKEMLRAGYGGLVLCAKDSEADLWRRYARECGCEDSLLFLDDSGVHRFNFLDAESRRSTRGGGMVENLVTLFRTAAEVSGRSHGGASGRDPYWEHGLDQLLRNSFDLLRLADEPVSIAAVSWLISDMAETQDEAMSPEWLDGSRVARLLYQARMRLENTDDLHDLGVTARFWLREFAGLHPKTRSSITSMFTGLADAFQRGVLYKLFSTETTFGPEVCFDGVVIVADLPLKLYHEAGRYAQTILKYVWQRAVEQRPRTDDPDDTRPVFLWADEAQGFLTSRDTEYQATAREKRAATVYLAQTISSYYASLGANSEHAVDSFLANLGTKIFHASGDPTTNQWAEKTFATTPVWQPSVNTPSGRGGHPKGKGANNPVTGGGLTRHDAALVPSREFPCLKTGGRDNAFIVEGIVFRNGRVWSASDSIVLKAEFPQRAAPLNPSSGRTKRRG